MKAIEIVQRFYPQVTSVKDAKRSLQINVSEADCRSPGVKKHKSCALAEACKSMREIDGAIISISAAYLIKGDTATRYKVPVSVSREIVAFDRSGGFEPGEYWLDKPQNKLGSPEGSGSRQRRKKPIPKKTGFRKSHATQGIRTDLRKAAAV